MEAPPVLHLSVGIASVVIVVLFVPIYIRIICIFLLNKSYRSLECYQIMIQIGITQCIMGPSWLFTGIAHIAQHDYANLAKYLYEVTGVAVRVEAYLSVLLAINRLRIICNWRWSRLSKRSQFKILYCTSAAIWIVCAVPFVILLTGKADFLVDPKEFLPRYDYEKPYSKTLQAFGSYQLIVTSLTTLILYITIVIYLIHRQFQAGISSEFNKEKTILVYALSRFAADFSAAVLYNLGGHFLPKCNAVDIFVFFTYPFNQLILPPVLYLTLYRSVRKEFFGKKKDVTQAATLFTVFPQATQS
ncbi:hypothetical protein QR680_010014 [Steinernema hermaphroditum]|uniref:Uncharacterized protein n=1 Tax=Steinernema hermaphroditum TaxID=289476 RepID=A0AA39MAG1_9BILA|nr:hypothetical protein QR680_010014 [Steinernema hermaphroditum]